MTVNTLSHRETLNQLNIPIMRLINHARESKKMYLLFVFVGLNCIFQHPCYSQQLSEEGKFPIPKVVSFNPDSNQYQCLFDGEKDSVVFYSGVVTLAPNESGEIHNTEMYEEMIIPLEGEGQLQIPDYKNLDVKFGTIAFVPPHTEHHMANTGSKNLKYIYVATKSK